MNENLSKAVILYEKAMKLIEEAQGIFKEEGITVSEPIDTYYRSKKEWEAQCYRGIKKFESKLNKVKNRPPIFIGQEGNKKVGHIKVGKINFIQLKDVKEDGYYLK